MQEPLFVALLFADRVIEETTHKKVIIGTFTHFFAEACPATFAPWYIYAAVGNLDVETKHSFSINIIQSESRMNVFSAGGELGITRPNAVAELVIPVANMAFPQFGAYSVEFNLDRRELVTRHLEVIPRTRGD